MRASSLGVIMELTGYPCGLRYPIVPQGRCTGHLEVVDCGE